MTALSKALPIVVALSALSACETVDLKTDTGSMTTMAVPTCSVAPGDYKLLAYWRDRSVDKQYGRIIDILEKKYASAPTQGGASALSLAQRFVSARTDLNPPDIEAMVEKSCQAKTASGS